MPGSAQGLIRYPVQLLTREHFRARSCDPPLQSVNSVSKPAYRPKSARVFRHILAGPAGCRTCKQALSPWDRYAFSRPARSSVNPPDIPEGLPLGLPVDLPATTSALLHQMPPPKELQPSRFVRKRPCPIPLFSSELKNTGLDGTARLQRGFKDFLQPSANGQSNLAPCTSSACVLVRPPTSPEGFVCRGFPPHNRPAFPSFTRQTFIPANVGSAVNDCPTE